MATDPNDPFTFPLDLGDLDDLEITQPLFPAKEEKKKPTCSSCLVELCHELDAYWGEELWGGELCYPCRKKHGIKG